MVREVSGKMIFQPSEMNSAEGGFVLTLLRFHYFNGNFLKVGFQDFEIMKSLLD